MKTEKQNFSKQNKTFVVQGIFKKKSHHKPDFKYHA